MDEVKKKIYIAGDHRGFELKKYLADELKARGYSIEDLGPYTYEPNDDYSDYAMKLGKEMSEAPDNNVGIVICKNGVGVSIAVNKYKGLRCALSWNPEHIKSARNDDDVNVLALPASFIDKETALEITTTFLETSASSEERHIRRRRKLESLGV